MFDLYCVCWTCYSSTVVTPFTPTPSPPSGIVRTDEIIFFQDQAVFDLNWDQILTFLHSEWWAPPNQSLRRAKSVGNGVIYLGLGYSNCIHSLTHTHTHTQTQTDTHTHTQTHTHTHIRTTPPVLPYLPSPFHSRSHSVSHTALLSHGPHPVTSPAFLHLPAATAVLYRGLHEGHECGCAGGLP